MMAFRLVFGLLLVAGILCLATYAATTVHLTISRPRLRHTT